MKFTFIAALLLCALHSLAQKNPVHLSYDLSKIKDNNYALRITATMDEGWHIYSQTQPADAIAQPTTIEFDKNPLIVIKGKPKEEGKKETYTDAAAGITQYQYADKMQFVQDVALKSAKVKTKLSGKIVYQTCTNEMCLPPKTENFSIVVE